MMNKSIVLNLSCWLAALSLTLMSSSDLQAQSDSDASSEPGATENATAPGSPDEDTSMSGEASNETSITDDANDTDNTAPTADDVRASLLEDIAPPPITKPNQRERVEDIPASIGVPAVQIAVDPAVLGTAPNQVAPTLRREGEFIIDRRGRLMRSPKGNHALFVFDADTKEDGQEPPMILMPCRLLQDMETIVIEQGDSIAFIISGQVHTYRGANYLLPTTMRPAVDRGNLD